MVNMTTLTSLFNPRQISAQEIHKACPLVPPSPAGECSNLPDISTLPPQAPRKTGTKAKVTVMRVTAPVLHSTPHWPSPAFFPGSLVLSSRQEPCRKRRNLVAPSSSDSLPRVKQKEHAWSPVSITNHNRAVTANLEASRAQHRQWVPITECTGHIERLTMVRRASKKLHMAAVTASTPGRTQPSESTQVMGLQGYAKAFHVQLHSCWKTPVRI